MQGIIKGQRNKRGETITKDRRRKNNKEGIKMGEETRKNKEENIIGGRKKEGSFISER
jgi:hypothetical protein